MLSGVIQFFFFGATRLLRTFLALRTENINNSCNITTAQKEESNKADEAFMDDVNMNNDEEEQKQAEQEEQQAADDARMRLLRLISVLVRKEEFSKRTKAINMMKLVEDFPEELGDNIYAICFETKVLTWQGLSWAR